MEDVGFMRILELLSPSTNLRTTKPGLFQEEDEEYVGALSVEEERDVEAYLMELSQSLQKTVLPRVYEKILYTLIL